MGSAALRRPLAGTGFQLTAATLLVCLAVPLSAATGMSIPLPGGVYRLAVGVATNLQGAAQAAFRIQAPPAKTSRVHEGAIVRTPHEKALAVRRAAPAAFVRAKHASSPRATKPKHVVAERVVRVPTRTPVIVSDSAPASAAPADSPAAAPPPAPAPAPAPDASSSNDSSAKPDSTPSDQGKTAPKSPKPKAPPPPQPPPTPTTTPTADAPAPKAPKPPKDAGSTPVTDPTATSPDPSAPPPPKPPKEPAPPPPPKAPKPPK